MTDELEWNGDEVFQRVRKRFEGRLNRLRDELVDAFELIGVRWDRAMGRRVSGPLVLGRPKGRGQLLASRRGLAGLKGGFFWEITGRRTVNTLALGLGNTERHALIHEFGTRGAGGTLPDITPKRAKALAWPVGPALTPAGVPREPGPRSYPDLFFLEFEGGGNVFGGLFQDEGGEPELYFLLARKSAIPPRLGMRLTFEKQQPKITREIADAIQRTLAA